MAKNRDDGFWSRLFRKNPDDNASTLSARHQEALEGIRTFAAEIREKDAAVQAAYNRGDEGRGDELELELGRMKTKLARLEKSAEDLGQSAEAAKIRELIRRAHELLGKNAGALPALCDDLEAKRAAAQSAEQAVRAAVEEMNEAFYRANAAPYRTNGLPGAPEAGWQSLLPVLDNEHLRARVQLLVGLEIMLPKPPAPPKPVVPAAGPRPALIEMEGPRFDRHVRGGIAPSADPRRAS